MHLRSRAISSVLVLAGLLPASLVAQPNVVAGTNVSLGDLGPITVLGRTGSSPNGTNGLAMATTSCNVGTVNVPWLQAMAENHPFIAFLVVLDDGQRLEQISDRSYVKHGFYALSNNQCTPCQQPSNGTFLGVGCSDTYAIANNGDNYWLAPPQEIDPWTGLWSAQGSHFDRGEPDVGPPQNNDGQRSLTQSQANALGPVGHRIRVRDADLQVPGATFYYQGHYVIRGEAESNRNDNLASRRFTATFNGSSWNITSSLPNNNQVTGTVLQRWSGATVTSATNGADDGRVYVAVKVSGPVGGLWHYEYAVHNRDNARGIQAFVLPKCSQARILNAGFRDVDQVATNQWTLTDAGQQLRFETMSFAQNPSANALEWNTIYNFWFDSDAEPVSGVASFEAFRPGPGAPSFGVTTMVPAALWNVHLGPGCGSPVPPVLATSGNPSRAVLGNIFLSLQCSNLQPFATCWFFLSPQSANVPLGSGCNLYLGGLPSQSWIWFTAAANSAGVASLATPVPNLQFLEGTGMTAQAAVPASPGAIAGFDLSNGLLVRIGTFISACP